MRWLDGITASIDISLRKLWKFVIGLVCCSPWGRKESDTTEQIELVHNKSKLLINTTYWINLKGIMLSEISMPGFPVHHQVLEFVQTHVHRVSNAIQLYHPLSLSSPPAFNLSQHLSLFLKESVLLIRWPKYWSFSFSISPSNEHTGLISFRIDGVDLLSVQGTLKSLLEHQSSKGSILQCSAFFIVQISYPYMATGKTIGLTRWTFVGKVMSLLFNMLSRLVITFLPRSKHPLISWL